MAVLIPRDNEALSYYMYTIKTVSDQHQQIFGCSTWSSHLQRHDLAPTISPPLIIWLRMRWSLMYELVDDDDAWLACARSSSFTLIYFG